MANSIVGGKPKRGISGQLRDVNGAAVLDETYIYTVRADSPEEPLLSVMSTPGIPSVNITQSPSGFGICRSKSVRQLTENASYFEVHCTFSSEVRENQNEDAQDPTSDPISWVPLYETNYERIQEPSIVDVNGDPVVNSNGRAFPNGIILPRTIPTWTFWQFEADSVTDDEMLDRCETINSNTFKGKDPYTFLLVVNKSLVGNYYGKRLRFSSYTLKYNKKNWRDKRADVDNGYLVSGVFTPNLVSVAGKPPVLMQCGLDGAGNKVADGTEPFILSFDQFEELDFNDFLRI